MNTIQVIFPNHRVIVNGHYYEYLELVNYRENLKYLVNPDEIVIPLTKIYLKYRHPFKEMVIVRHEKDSSEGFTRRELAEIIVNDYREFYLSRKTTISKWLCFKRKKVKATDEPLLAISKVQQVSPVLFEVIIVG